MSKSKKQVPIKGTAMDGRPLMKMTSIPLPEERGRPPGTVTPLPPQKPVQPPPPVPAKK